MWKTLLVLGLAVVLGLWLLWTGPQTTPVEKTQAPKMVQTVQVHPSSHAIAVAAYGTVIPARRVTIEPEVSGLVIRQHPELIPGGHIREGAILFEIDSTLMQLNLEEATAAVARAEAELTEAERQRDQIQQLAAEQVVPETELEATESTVRVQQADLQRLKASLRRSEELLKRHHVRAPFNALVVDEEVEIGQRVDPGFEAVTLVGTDEFWVRASLPMDKLPWVSLPRADHAGATAEVYLAMGNGSRIHRTGQIVRLMGNLDEVGRMARVLVRIKDPLGLEGDGPKEPFLLNSYVRLEIDAGTLEDVLAISRTALRENNRIWVVGSDNELQIRDVEIRWTTDETVYINNALGPDEALVVSSLRVALPGMKVQAEPIDAQASRPTDFTYRH